MGAPSSSRSATTRRKRATAEALRRALAEDGPVDRPDETLPGRPTRRRRAGRTNSSNVTKLETGLPGRPNRSVRPPSGRSTTPNANGLPGWTATRHSSIRPISANAARTWSYGPTETPPETMTASTSPGGRSAGGPGRPRVGPPRSRGRTPRRPPPRRGREPRPVRVRDPGRAERATGGPDLVAGRQDPDPRPAVDGELPLPEPAARAIAAGPSTVPAGRIATASGRSSPARRIAAPARTASWTRTLGGQRAGRVAAARAARGAVAVGRRRQLDLDDRVGPGRDRAPVAIRIAVPRSTSRSGAWPARTSPTTSSRAGASSLAAATSAARIA